MMTTTDTTQSGLEAFRARHEKLFHAAERVCDVMYGTQQRTWITLAVTFGMLVGGISMMQLAANGGMCAAIGG